MVQNNQNSASDVESVTASLTRREREVLELIGRGLSLPEIAERLYRSQKTIESHRLSLGKKLGMSNRVELARFAIQAGLAPLPETPHISAQQTQQDELRKNIDAQQDALNALRTIEAGVASVTGHAYLHRLTELLCEALPIRTAWVSQVDELGQLQDVIVYDRSQLLDPPVYDSGDQPCYKALETGFYRVKNNIRDIFPDSLLMQMIDAHAYLGIRLDRDTTDPPMGVLAVASDKPISDACHPELILRLCAARAAAELCRARTSERLRAFSETLEAKVAQRTRQLAQVNRQLRERLEQLHATQNRLRESARLYQTLVETINDGLGIIDTQGVIVYANAAFCKLMGRPAQQLLGKSPADFAATEDDAKRFRGFDQLRVKDQMKEYAMRFRRGDGTTFSAHIAPRSLFTETGEYIGSVGVLKDIGNQANDAAKTSCTHRL